MPKQKTQNPKEKKISIEAEMNIPLEELAIYVLPKKEDRAKVVDLLDAKPQVVNKFMRMTAKEIISNKKVDVKLKNLEFNYMDSGNISHGAAYFKVTLKGTETALRKVAGEDKLFSFDWPQADDN